MRNFASTNRRLRTIEGTRGAATITLFFPDATTRGVHVSPDYQLKLFADVSAKLRAHPPQPPEGIILPPPPPEPTTPSDSLIDLMAGAESVESDRFFQTIFEMCKTLGERRKEKLK